MNIFSDPIYDHTSDWVDAESIKEIKYRLNSTTSSTINTRNQATSTDKNKRQDRRMLESPSFQDDELPFQKGTPLDEEESLITQDPFHGVHLKDPRANFGV